MGASRDRGTIGELAAHAGAVHVYCQTMGCRHWVRVLSDDLVVRYGAATPVQAWVDRLKCAVCGRKEVTLSVQPRTKEYGFGPGHPSTSSG